MGIFGPSKIKITPADFANTQLEKLFSHEFADEERKNFAQLSMAIPLLHAVSLADYLRERQN